MEFNRRLVLQIGFLQALLVRHLVLFLIETIELGTERLNQALDLDVGVEGFPGTPASIALAGLRYQCERVQAVLEFLHGDAEDLVG